MDFIRSFKEKKMKKCTYHLSFIIISILFLNSAFHTFGALDASDLEKRKNSVVDGAKLQMQGIIAKVSDYLVEENFDELEEIATYLRKEKVRSRGGSWQLDFYYDNLALRWRKFGPEREKWLFDVLDRWVSEKPESVTPLLVMAKAHIDYAWHIRGGGYASEVTEEGWKGFKSRLNIAWNILEKVEMMPAKDAEVYSLFIKTGLGLGKSDEELDHFFEKGIKIESGYIPLYLERATSLMPRWRGKKGELEAFMDRAVEITKEEEGTSYYVRISNMVFRYFKFNDFQDKFDIPYEKVKQSYWDLLERYPDTQYFLSAFCYCACKHKDRETALKLFKKIGNKPDYSAWRGKKSYYYYKNWALN
jgi:hypothetical protein